MLGEIKLKKKILWRNTLNEIQSNLFNTFSNIIPIELFKMKVIDKVTPEKAEWAADQFIEYFKNFSSIED